MEHESRGSIWISILILVFLVMGTTLAILYAKGYRFNFLSGKPNCLQTGLLVTTSIPDGAAVFVNGALKNCDQQYTRSGTGAIHHHYLQRRLLLLEKM